MHQIRRVIGLSGYTTADLLLLICNEDNLPFDIHSVHGGHTARLVIMRLRILLGGARGQYSSNSSSFSRFVQTCRRGVLQWIHRHIGAAPVQADLVQAASRTAIASDDERYLE
jgi:hypothetical protein